MPANSNPAAAEAPHDEVDAMLNSAATVAKTLPNLAATLTDVVDDVAAGASQQGINIDERLQGLMGLLLKLTEPDKLQAASSLIERLPELQKLSGLVEDLPGLVATFADVMDEWATACQRDGIDIENGFKHGLRAALWLGGRVSELDLERIGELLHSDVLDENAIRAVSLAGRSLAKCNTNKCEMKSPERVGALGLLKALRDPATQRALGFGLQFAKCFGSALDNEPQNGQRPIGPH